MRFILESLPIRAIFGSGASAASIVDEIDRLRARRVMLICSVRERPRAERIAHGLGSRLVGSFDGVRQHVPIAVAEAARARAREVDADVLLSIGGGSTTGTAKAVALTRPIPIVAIPTTFAGSEVTPVWGITTDARKETGVDAAVLPASVIYDPDLVAELPDEIAVASAVNAMAHCVEALWTPRSNPFIASMASEGLRALTRGLRGSNGHPDPVGRESLLYGSMLAGMSYAGAGSGLHHKLCHALGGAFDLPHAALHGVMLPRVLDFNREATPDVAERVAAALGSISGVEGLDELYASIGASRRLSEIGLRSDQFEHAVAVAAALLPIPNPRPVSRDGIREILSAAF